MNHYTIYAAAVKFLSLCLFIATTNACEEEALFAVEDTFEGVIISTFHPAAVPSSSQESQRLPLLGHHLSEECGTRFFRCENLLRETVYAAGIQQTLVFVPLVEGLAVVGMSRNSNTQQFHITLHTILRTSGTSLMEISCSPSTVYKILDGYFTVCTNQTTNYVSVFEVHLNKSAPQNSGITYPINQLTIPPFVGNIANASNFVHVELDRNHEYIIFAVGTTIYSMRPLLYAAGPLGNGVPSATCERVHTLVHQQEAVLYAHCTEHIFTYDVGEENWLVQDTFARRGVPYPCPNQERDLSVFTDHIRYTLDGQVEEVEIQGSAYSSGVCFGNTTQSYFAYRDKNLGVFSLDLHSNNKVLISSSPCGDTCYPLTVIDSRYLIVAEDSSSTLLVLDYLGSRLRLIEARHTSAALTTVISLECPPQNPVTTRPTKHHITTGTDAHTSSSGGGSTEATPPPHITGGKRKTLVIMTSVLVPAAIVVVVGTVLVSGLIIFLVLRHSRIRAPPSTPPPVQEMGVPVQASRELQVEEQKGYENCCSEEDSFLK